MEDVVGEADDDDDVDADVDIDAHVDEIISPLRIAADLYM